TEGPSGASRLAGALRGARFQLAAFEPTHPREALAQLPSDFHVKELAFTFFAGEAVYLATDAPQRTRVVPVRYQSAAFFAPDSFDLPWLYRYRPAWDIFVLVLLLGGASLSVTAVTIGWQLLGNKLRRAGRFQ